MKKIRDTSTELQTQKHPPSASTPLLLRESVLHSTGARPFSIHYTKNSSSSQLALYLHWHEEAEFFYLESGEVLLHAGDEYFHLYTGDAILIPPFLLHSADSRGAAPCSHYAFVFSPSLLTDSTQDYDYYSYLTLLQGASAGHCLLIPGSEREHDSRAAASTLLPFSSGKEVLAELQQIFHCYDHPLRRCELSVHGHFLILWQLLYNYLVEADPAYTSASPLFLQIDPALIYMKEHFMEDLSLEELSSCVYLSREQFCRLFRKVTGLTPFTYLNRLRIQKSCEFLLHSDKKTADIASLCGYNNISYFNRVFMKFMHMTPSAYRTNAASSGQISPKCWNAL